MTPAQFRKLALSLPESEEKSHMDHPDFRVGNKIFATLHPDGERAMVQLDTDQQEAFVRTQAGSFAPVPGAWGLRGATYITLKTADRTAVQDALALAWRNRAPKKLLAKEPE